MTYVEWIAFSPVIGVTLYVAGTFLIDHYFSRKEEFCDRITDKLTNEDNDGQG